MTDIHKKRLRKLIAFLRKLGVRKFEFSHTVWETKNGCGSVCCAIGWTPEVFPDLVEWVKNFAGDSLNLGYVDNKSADPEFYEIAKYLFGIDSRQAGYLFAPHEGNGQGVEYIHPNLPIVHNTGTPKEVAKLLSTYLKLVNSKEIDPIQLV